MKIILVSIVLIFSLIACTNSEERIRTKLQMASEASDKGDYSLAIKTYQPLAEQGNAEAQWNLGAYYYDGLGIPKDYKQSAFWLNKCAEQNGYYKFWSMWLLGLMYMDGNGVPKDLKKAAEMMTLSAEYGIAEAQYEIGRMYFNGQGVLADKKLAAEWYTKAAMSGQHKAPEMLGLMYYLGEGVTKDMPTAYAWNNLAATQGDTDARRSRDFIAKSLSKTELASAQDLSKTLYHKIYEK